MESAARTTNALVEAARDAIAVRGWDATTMEEIAAAFAADGIPRGFHEAAAAVYRST
jgi:AcrR family transcriptional regulator